MKKFLFLCKITRKEQANEKKKDKKKNNDYSSDEDDFKVKYLHSLY